jgi:2-oxoisovalerate dehydrogenase E2 component (dihydrolipoyl transacylase)
MPDLREFRLPDLGEGLTEGEILGWLVAEGETITLNQPIVEVETAKAAVEVPSPYAGLVVRLHHGAGETVDVGATIITVDTAPGTGTLVPEHEAPPVPTASADDLVPTLPDTLDPDAGLIGGAAPGGRTAVLVGYGPKTVTAARRPRRAAAAAGTGTPVAAATVEPARPPAPPVTPPVTAPVVAPAATRALAKPPVRKLARDLGIDLAALVGSGAGGIVTRADVTSAKAPATSPAASRADGAGAGERRIAVKGVRRLTAANMVASAFTAPHVTEFLTCDVSPTMELLGRLKTLPEFAGSKVTPLLLVAKALLVACRRHPEINASWDEPAQEIVVHGAVNLGIAAATPRGLLVPNIKDAGGLDLPGLAAALTALTSVAKEGRTAPADMAGGTITITNVGMFGVDTGTPILNPGEAAIVCLGAIRDTPWVHQGAVAVRKVTTLGMSFDHRMVDGQLGSEVLADVGAMLADPAVLLAWS